MPGYFCMTLMYILKIKYRFFLLVHKSPQLGSTLLSLQEERHPWVGTWQNNSGSAVISSATNLLLDCFVNELRLINTNTKKMHAWTLNIYKHLTILLVSPDNVQPQTIWSDNIIKMLHTKWRSCDFCLFQQLEHINQPWSHERPSILESQLLGKREPKKKIPFYLIRCLNTFEKNFLTKIYKKRKSEDDKTF